MMARLLGLPHELGGLGLAALALIAAAAAFHLMVVKPLAASNARLDERLQRQAPRGDPGQPAAVADKVAAVYAFLAKDEQTTDWLAKLHGIGRATGVQLKSGSYRTQSADGRIVRFEIVLPVAGSYAQIRDFLMRSSAEIPVMSIDQLLLKRESREDGTLQGELRLTLHMVKS